MVVLVNLTRTLVQEQWVPKLYGDSARPLLTDCERAEAEIWRIAEPVLKPVQRQELRDAIDTWWKERPNQESALYTRALGLAAELGKTNQQPSEDSSSVFSFLMLDPLSGLDPATRELAQTRLLAERALYMGQRMPLVLRGEVELLAMNFFEMPETQQLLTNSTQLSASLDRVSRTTEQLPDRISSERKEILQALNEQSGKLTGLVGETRQALDAGEKMSTSLNTTLVTFDGLMKRFGVGEPKPESSQDTNSPPFNILDYAKTASELAAAAQQLDTVLRSFNGTLGSPVWNQRLTDFKGASEQARENVNGVLNHAFLLAAALILFAFGCAFFYRLLAARTGPTNHSNAASNEEDLRPKTWSHPKSEG